VFRAGTHRIGGDHARGALKMRDTIEVILDVPLPSN